MMPSSWWKTYRATLQQGMSRFEAALQSSRQLFGPIVAMTITLAVVYAPIGFLSGLTGVLFSRSSRSRSRSP